MERDLFLYPDFDPTELSLLAADIDDVFPVLEEEEIDVTSIQCRHVSVTA